LAILAYLPKPALEDTMVALWVKEGRGAALAHYRSFTADPLNKYADTAWSLRLVGRRLMNVHKRPGEALDVFRLSTQEHPEIADTWIVLGEAPQQAGDVEQARSAWSTPCAEMRCTSFASCTGRSRGRDRTKSGRVQSGARRPGNDGSGGNVGTLESVSCRF
jgi:hypothetical protein